MVLSVTNLFVIETVVVLRASMSQGVVLRMVSLNQNPAGPITTTGAPRDLSYKLKRAFR